MDVFGLRNRLVKDYEEYTRSFIKIADERIRKRVNEELSQGVLWPEPLLQLNPTFLPGGTIDDLVADGTLHPECARIFRIEKRDKDLTGRKLLLHTHQTKAIRKAKEGRSYVLTSGTGSGKSLAYIVPIVDHVLRQGSGCGIQAIVVYPMNALANSQGEELKKFLEKGYPEGESPVRFARYTGQEGREERESIRDNPPDILLTNYMMLELLLTRVEDRSLVKAAQGLRFLVFDELHTYRGPQGADVALLIRRCRLAFGGHDIICVGTSATMASEGSSLDQKREVAQVAQTLFGTPIDPDHVIGETLERSTLELDLSNPEIVKALSETIQSGQPPPDNYEAFRTHPLCAWIESTFGVQTEPETGRLIRQAPKRLRGEHSAAAQLAALTSTDEEPCYDVLRRFLMGGSHLRRSASSRFPIFAFRLHQFLTRGDTVWATIEPEAVRHLEMAKLGSKPGGPTKPLFPLVFCRQCGTAYYRASIRSDEHGSYLAPREDPREPDDDGSKDAYLYLSEAHPWPRTEGPDLMARLPAFMRETTARGVERIRPDNRGDLPEPVFVDACGRIVSEGDGLPAALIRRNFLFCLEPSCGIAYVKTQRSEISKLGTLGVDKRSTATTILAERRRRVRYWSALALLRCVSSSPAAAAATLRNRAAVDEAPDDEIDEVGRRTVLDQDDVDDVATLDFSPGSDSKADPESTRRKLLAFARRAEDLFGKPDAKLQGAAREVKDLLRDGFHPMVFCGFVDTAQYVAQQLRDALPKKVRVESVTGLLPPAERQSRIEALVEEGGDYVLVCTDCLSEGVNLQQHFDAVFHYDLCWNPTRHEQREGRVDRFGQARPEVRVITYYGQDNPIDGVILDVLIRKHKSIKSDLGVTVAVPGTSEQIAETLFEGALFREQTATAGRQVQLKLDFGDDTRPKIDAFHCRWEDARDREKSGRSRFAQLTLVSDTVAAELAGVRQAVGRSEEVERFFRSVLQAAKVTVKDRASAVRVHLSDETPRALRQALGRDEPFAGRFDLPLEEGQVYLGRTSPVVEGLASWTLDQALDIKTSLPRPLTSRWAC